MTTSTGSCLCGAIGYEVRGEIGVAYFCHCSRCRKVSGSAFSSSAVVSPEDFFLTRGKEALHSYTNEAGVSRWFCSNCGSHIYVSQGDQMRLRLGSLDSELADPPRMHIFTASKAPWFTIADDLPPYAERPARMG